MDHTGRDEPYQPEKGPPDRSVSVGLTSLGLGFWLTPCFRADLVVPYSSETAASSEIRRCGLAG